MKIWKLVIACVFAGSVCLAAASAAVQDQQRTLSDKLIRLHVIAASDSEEDQNVKLKVRDAVMVYLQSRQWESRKDAVLWLEKNLQNISDLSLSVLADTGKPDNITVSLGHEQYPTRYYDDFTLPAGDYVSLKVKIGEGEGKNWWCVVYPSICMSAGGDAFAAKAASAGLTGNEIAFITEENAEIRIKFKLLEALNLLQKSLQDT